MTDPRAMLIAVLVVGAPMLPAQPSLAQQSMQINVDQGLGAVGVSRDEAGRRVSFICPAGDGKTRGTLYGTDVYMDSSPICPAAIHAGVLKPGRAGVVTIVLGAGAQSFKGSERNGVTTLSYGRYGYSYTFARDGEPGTISWRTTWNWNERLVAELTGPIALECPPGGKPEALVYGTDVYAVGSAICVAAVHAGAITAERGGVVTVTRAPALRDDTGSERFGIASRSLRATTEAFGVTAANPLTMSTVLLAPALLQMPAGDGAPGTQMDSGGTAAIMDPGGRIADRLERGDALATGRESPPSLAATTSTGHAPAPQNPASVTATKRDTDVVAGAISTPAGEWPRDTVIVGATGTASTDAAIVAARTINLVGFTATGTFVVAPPRTIGLAGFTASGTFIVVAPRVVTLSGWSAAGSAPTVQGVVR